MKQRNILTLILLNIVTIGFYSIYWLYDTRKEMVAKGQNIPSFGWLIWPWLIWGASFFIPVLAGDGPTASILLAVSLLGYFAIIGIYLWWFWPYSKAVDVVTDNRLEAVAAYILIILLGSIGFLIVQYYFNRVEASEKTAASPVQ
jgi:hypothetical protein